jgi:hypothetical protein
VAVNGKKPISRIERALEEYGALPHMQTLVAAGCKRDEILAAMKLAFLADESWEKQVKMNLRTLKGSIAQIRHCSRIIDRLNASELIYRASIEYRIPQSVGLRESPTLAQRLREYADMLDWLRHVFGPERNIRRHTWKGWIVAIVMEDTKRPHDREVSSLIAAVLDDSRYSESAHRAWRSKHTDVVDLMRETLQEHRRENVLRSPPI